MAHPKRRHSNQRTRKRRTHDKHKLSAPTLYACPQCKSMKLPHALCSNCGYYGKRQVVEVKEVK